MMRWGCRLPMVTSKPRANAAATAWRPMNPEPPRIKIRAMLRLLAQRIADHKRMSELTVFYDASCPVCRAEMDTLAAARPDALRLIDISRGDVAVRHGERTLAQPELMASLHALDGETLLVGVPAFAAVYRRVGFDALAKALGRFEWLLAPIYRFIAPRRWLISALGLHHVLAWWLGRKLKRMRQCSMSDCER